MKCDSTLLQRRLDGDLGIEEAGKLEEHLASCPACRLELRYLEALGEELRAWGGEVGTCGEKLPLWEGIRGEILRPVPGRRIQFAPPRWVSWGAGILAAASLVVGLFLWSGRSPALPKNYCRVNSASAPKHSLMIYQQPEDGLTVLWLQEQG